MLTYFLVVVWILAIIFVYFALSSETTFKLEKGGVWRELNSAEKIIVLFLTLVMAPVFAGICAILMRYQSRVTEKREQEGAP